MYLVLGVIDVPYTDADAPPRKIPQAKSGKANHPLAKSADLDAPATTGGVAELLEHNYSVMGAFAKAHAQDIERAIIKSLEGQIVNLSLGAPVLDSGAAFAEACESIAQDFRDFLDKSEIEQMGIPGVPTQAAKDGVNHRLKNPYSKDNPRRPSFVDTGLYQTTMRAWTE
ncbi:hypothetical protein [Paraburkholderia tropica]|uniref:hypothetical protein n=1 Tax=Paraburkholderia tropica TaxID=92647 RepID=UPI002AB6B285|nr:hypothetical protein [Paraburkholderia tropica]